MWSILKNNVCFQRWNRPISSCATTRLNLFSRYQICSLNFEWMSAIKVKLPTWPTWPEDRRASLEEWYAALYRTCEMPTECSAWRTCGPGLKKKQVQPQLKSPRLLNKLFLLWLATPKSWSWGEEGGDLNSCFFPTVWNDTILCCQLWPSHWDWVMNNNLHSALFFFFLLFAGYLPLSWESSECM